MVTMSRPVASKRKSKILLLALGLLLGLALLGVLAPTLLSGVVARRIEAEFGQRCAGRLEVGELRLAWRERQSLRGARLIDPQGTPVGEVSLELPSLLELLQSDGVRLGRITAQFEARLVADDNGITNLQRALQPRQSATDEMPESDAAAAEKTEPFDPQQLEFEFILQAPSVAWSDTATRAAGADFELRDLWFRVRAERGKALDLELRGAVSGGGALQGRAQVEGLRNDPRQPFARVLADFDIRGLASGLIDGITQGGGEVSQLLGPSLDLALHVEAQGLESGSARIGLTSERAQLNFAASLRERVLSLEGERGAELSLRVPLERLQRELPAGYRVQSQDPLLRVDVRLPKLTTRLDWPKTDDAAGWSAFASVLLAQVQIAVPGPLSIQTPQMASCNENVLVRDALLRAGMEPGKAPEASLSLLLDTGLAGTVRVQARAEQTTEQLLEALQSGAQPRVQLSLACTNISTALLDAVLGAGSGREDLLQSALGRGLDLDLKLTELQLSEPSGGQARVELSARSAQFDLSVRGQLSPERFVAAGSDAVELVFLPQASWWKSWLPPDSPELAILVRQPRFKAQVQSLELPLRAVDLAQLQAGLSAAVQCEFPSLEFTRGAEAARLSEVALQLAVARGGLLGFRVETKLFQQWATRVELRGEVGPWAELAAGRVPALTADLRLDELDVQALEALAGLDLELLRRLGERADLQLRVEDLRMPDAKAVSSTASVRVGLQTPKWKLALEARAAEQLVSGQLKLAGTLEQADLAAECARFAPPGWKLLLREQGAVELNVSHAQARWPDESELADPQAWLRGLALEFGLRVPALSVSLPELEAQGLQLALRSLALEGGWQQERGRASVRSEWIEETGQLSALLGREFKLDLNGDCTLEQQSVQLRAQAERFQFDLSAKLTPERAALTGSGLALQWQGDAARCREELRALLPENIVAEPLPEAGFALSLASQDLALRVPAAGGDWLEGLQGRVRATLPGFSLRLDGPESVPLVIARAELDVQLDGKSSFDAVLGADGSGSLQLELEPRAELDAVLRNLGPVQLALSAKNLPLAAVDSLVDPHGMLTELLGERVDLELESEAWSVASGELKGSLRSEQFAVELEGSVGTSGVRITKPGGLAASFGLGPLSSENFLGGVLPMVCTVTKPAESKPARLVVQALDFPATGDLSKLNADLTLELGEIQYSFLPGLSEAFGSAATLERTQLRSFPIRIQQGVVRYEQLPLKLGGKEVLFSGSYQLADQKLSLSFAIPLELLGKKVSKELEKARDFLDPKLVVPLEIRGTPAAPKLSIGKGFLESVVKKALEKQLQKGLESLFAEDKDKPKPR
jgi:hypothetical protein